MSPLDEAEANLARLLSHLECLVAIRLTREETGRIMGVSPVSHGSALAALGAWSGLGGWEGFPYGWATAGWVQGAQVDVLVRSLRDLFGHACPLDLKRWRVKLDPPEHYTVPLAEGTLLA